MAGLFIVIALVAGFSASIALIIRRLFPSLALRRRQLVAPLIGALMTMGPAFVAAAKTGGSAVLQVALFCAVLALVAGYPAVRFFDTPPKDGEGGA